MKIKETIYINLPIKLFFGVYIMHQNPEKFLMLLEKALNSENEEENSITQKFLIKLYIEFMVNFNKNNKNFRIYKWLFEEKNNWIR